MFLEDMNLLLQILSFQIHLQWTVVSNKHKSFGERLIGSTYLPYEIWQTVCEHIGGQTTSEEGELWTNH